MSAARLSAVSLSAVRLRGWFALLTGFTLGASADAASWNDWLTPEHTPTRVQTGEYPERVFRSPSAGAPRRGTVEPKAVLPVFLQQPGPGCRKPWLLVAAQGWICADATTKTDLPSIAPQLQPSLSQDGLPFHYFRVGEVGARAYATLPDVANGKVASELEPDFIIAISRVASFQGLDFGLSSKGTWVAIEELQPLSPSRFAGTEVQGDLAQLAWTRRRGAWLYRSVGGARIESLQPQQQLHVVSQTRRGGTNWLEIAQLGWVRESDVRHPTTATPPADVLPGERWLDIDLQQQVLTAYEGTDAVFATLVSSGKGQEGTPLGTPKGEHRIWVKLRTTDMSNLEDEEAARYYAIQEVPWVMYFKDGYGLHGAFWHHSFGEVRSHGCVNLAPRDAERLFYWASPRLPAGWSAVLPTSHDRGTRVVVR